MGRYLQRHFDLHYLFFQLPQLTSLQCCMSGISKMWHLHHWWYTSYSETLETLSWTAEHLCCCHCCYHWWYVSKWDLKSLSWVSFNNQYWVWTIFFAATISCSSTLMPTLNFSSTDSRKNREHTYKPCSCFSAYLSVLFPFLPYTATEIFFLL